MHAYILHCALFRELAAGHYTNLLVALLVKYGNETYLAGADDALLIGWQHVLFIIIIMQQCDTSSWTMHVVTVSLGLS